MLLGGPVVSEGGERSVKALFSHSWMTIKSSTHVNSTEQLPPLW